MSEIVPPLEAEVVHDIPDNLACAIGRLVTIHSKLEYKLTALSTLLLQLNKSEARIVLREPRAVDRLDMALDLFAIKDIETAVDTEGLRLTLQAITADRDRIAHGVWLKHPHSGELFLRITRGDWPKTMTKGDKVKRAIFPQSIRYEATDCLKTVQLAEKALQQIDDLGAEIDRALQSFPERFRPPSPVLNPLGRRVRQGKRRQPKPSQA